MPKPQGTEEDGKQPFTIRLSAEGRRILAEVAQRRGISRTAVIEQAIRDYAKQYGVE